DEASTTLYISPQVEPLLGCTQEEYAADPDLWLRLVHPEDRERVLADVARCHETGEPLATEYRMVTGDGRIAWFRDQAAIVRDETGAGGVLLGVMTDITELKRAEEALRESEEQLRAVFESSHDLLSLTDDGGRALLANSAWQRILGYMPQEEEHSRDRTHPDDRARVLEAWEAFVGNDSPITDLVHRYQTAGGDYVFLKTTARRVTVGGQRCCFVSSRDVTARVRAEQERRRLTEQYRDVTNLTGDIIVKLDEEGSWTFLNDGACECWGEPREKLLGRKAIDYVHPDDVEKTNAAGRGLVESVDMVRGLTNRQKTPNGWRTVEECHAHRRRGRKLRRVPGYRQGHHRARAGARGAAGERGEIPPPLRGPERCGLCR
ncbi:MAG: PAS domain S-box protein, partial [Candidatus Brocadiia bacterium]|nr:PAS domain S-box protein [Candidatus Brocadiia bacterium]